MKILNRYSKLVLAVGVAAASSSISLADRNHGDRDHGRGGWDRDHGHGRGRDHWRDGWYGGGRVIYRGSCSPEAAQKNTQIVDSTILNLSQSDEFKNAQTFQEAIAEVQTVQSAESRLAAYCFMVGVNPSKPEEIVDFIGARDHSVYVAKAQQELQLTQEQANILVRELSTSLLNGINR